MSTGLSSGLAKTGMRQINIPTMSPDKASFFNEIMGKLRPGMASTVQGLSGIAGGDMSSLAPLEQQAFKDFGGLQGSIASRFSGQGSGARRSSGFQNYMGEQASDLASQLAGQRLSFQQSAQKSLMDLFNQIMGQDEFDTFLTQKQKKTPLWKSLVGGALPLAGAGLGAAFGGPMGMAMGSQLGSGLGGAITGGGGGMDFSGLGRLPTKWG